MSSFALQQTNFYFLELGNQGWENHTIHPPISPAIQLLKRNRNSPHSPSKYVRLPYKPFLQNSASGCRRSCQVDSLKGPGCHQVCPALSAQQHEAGQQQPAHQRLSDQLLLAEGRPASLCYQRSCRIDLTPLILKKICINCLNRLTGLSKLNLSAKSLIFDLHYKIVKFPAIGPLQRKADRIAPGNAMHFISVVIRFSHR